MTEKKQRRLKKSEHAFDQITNKKKKEKKNQRIYQSEFEWQRKISTAHERGQTKCTKIVKARRNERRKFNTNNKKTHTHIHTKHTTIHK